MFKSMRKTLATFVASLALAVVPLAVVPAAVSAQSIEDNLKQGSCLSTDTACQVDEGETRINQIITTVVNIFSLIVGIVAVIMIVYGGFRYITSGGDSGNVSSAKNTIIYAVIGLVIVAFAQFIVQFVLGKAFEQTS